MLPLPLWKHHRFRMRIVAEDRCTTTSSTFSKRWTWKMCAQPRQRSLERLRRRLLNIGAIMALRLNHVSLEMYMSRLGQHGLCLELRSVQEATRERLLWVSRYRCDRVRWRERVFGVRALEEAASSWTPQSGARCGVEWFSRTRHLSRRCVIPSRQLFSSKPFSKRFTAIATQQIAAAFASPQTC